MIVNARFAAPCGDCGAGGDEACDETCPSYLSTAGADVPGPRAAQSEPHRAQGEAMSQLWLGEREGLSAPEGAIVALIVLGLTNQEIADALHMSVQATKAHIRSAYRTMGVGSRTRAISWGVRHGFQLARGARLDAAAQR